MKHMNDDSSHYRVRSDGSRSSAFSGRCLDIDEDSPFNDLSAVYACSDQAQFAALDATSGIFVREVAHYLGLAGPDLTIPYDFAPLAETVRRRSGRKRRNGTSATSTSDSAGYGENADHETAAPIGGHTPTSSRKKDRGAGRRMRREQREAREHPEQLPDFPAFSPTSTFNGWTHQYAWAEDISEYSALLGATTSGAYKHITSAMTLVHGLPKFHQRCSDGDFTIEHVAFVTRRCRDVAFRYLPSIDDYLADRRADITIETFKRSLTLKIAATQPAEETLEKVAVRRRVDISTGDDGTAYLTLTGPAPELHACYRRVEAFARAVYKGNTAAFGDQLMPGESFDDDRGIDALMLDIFTRTRPQLKLRITSNNTTTGDTSSTDFPIDGLFAGPDGVPMSPEESLLDYIERTFGQMGDEASAAADAEGQGQAAPDYWLRDPRFFEALKNSRPAPGTASRPPGSDPHAPFGTGSSPPDDGSSCAVSYEVLLDMPTHEYWLSHQARTTITVPMFTLLSQFLRTSGDDASTAAVRAPETETHSEGPTAEAEEETGTNGKAEAAAWTTASSANTADKQWADADVCDLAGMLPDGSPLPADMARRLAGYASTWTRILTDPATGTPLDAKATSYTIPNSIRQPLAAQWMNCTMPGCIRRAEATEVDHIIPFDHDSPESGGATRFGNLHHLCKQHHQAKTDRKFSVRMTEPGRLEYTFKHGITTEVMPPDNPINVEHAKLFLKYFATPPPQPTAPQPTAPPPTEPPTAPPTVVPPTAPSPAGAAPSGTEAVPSGTEAVLSKKERQRKQAKAEEKPSTVQSETAQSTTDPAGGNQCPGWVEYVDPFSRQPEQNAKLWFWDSGEQPPF
ncbi:MULTISPECIES: HNH endonuclease signature motif containing protein [Brevibacterium]|uniref:HNH endonuclease n=2 Tax=Brevibacterium antiquum TaxID=234835 RepID=A0A2H1HKC4_9MICO|nr:MULTISPECIES: HNH endonuclease signature motif containing protein [Brevibacterium]SMX63320.1 HNH endonuclease [Brevibacterium antiquum CNRZ 918]SMX63896.1 HNH endonuclease [Brevibacterium antiquum]